MTSSQSQWVLSRLELGEHLSSRDAVINYGIQDLPKRISELRDMGYKIHGERVEGKTCHGGRTHWNLYWMEVEHGTDSN